MGQALLRSMPRLLLLLLLPWLFVPGLWLGGECAGHGVWERWHLARRLGFGGVGCG